MKHRARLEGSNTLHHRRSRNKHDEKANSLKNSRGKDTTEYTGQSAYDNNHLMKSLRKELDEVKNAMKGKTAMNLDGMLKRTDSPFIASVLDCPLPPKFRLPQLEFYNGMKDPLDHIGGLQDYLEPLSNHRRSYLQIFPCHTQGGQLEFGLVSCQRLPQQILNSSATHLFAISLEDSVIRNQPLTY